MRIAKYPPICGIGADFHSVAPTSGPATNPVNPALIPTYLWFAVITNPISGFALTGKWSWQRVTVEGIGNILWGHDWGPGQLHIPLPPISVTPSIPLRFLASSTKYWLPSFSVREPVDGSAPGGDTPVAVSTPAWVTFTQNCQDASGWPFVAPTSLCFQLVSTKHVAFTVGDFLAGAIGMAGDAIAAVAGRAIGGKLTEIQAIAGASSGALINHLLSRLPSLGEPADTIRSGLMNAAAMVGIGDGAGGGNRNAAAAFVAPLISLGASYCAGKASDANGSGPTYRRGLNGPIIDSETRQEVSP